MGEDIEPMIDQEMFLQMMESMDKDGDGTVTKASHTPHARALTHRSLRTHACAYMGGVHTRTSSPSVEFQCARLVHGSAACPCLPPHACHGHRPALLVRRPGGGAQLVEPVIRQHQTRDVL